MASQQPVHILGAGIAGLTLGKYLKSVGIPTILFEKGPSPAQHNYGISLHCWPPLLELLNMDEITFRSRLAVDRGNSGNGRIYPKRHLPSATSRNGSYYFRAHRGRLESLLREGLEIKWKHTYDHVSRTTAGNVIAFKEGERIASSLIVDTCGVHSPTRNNTLKPSLHILPYVVFRGTRSLPIDHFKAIYESSFDDGNILELKKGDTVLQISINDYRTDAQTVDISYIYSRPASSNDSLHKPERAKEDATQIPEEFYQEISQLVDIEPPFNDVFEVTRMRNDRILHWLMRSSLVPMQELDRFAESGILLLGDAAHAMPIVGGEGANAAIVDGIKLGDYLACKGTEKGFREKMYPLWANDVRDSEERLADMHSKRRPLVL